MGLQVFSIVFFCIAYLLSSTAGQWNDKAETVMSTQAPTLAPTPASTPPPTFSFASFCDRPYASTNESDVPCGESCVMRLLECGKALSLYLIQ